MQTTMKSDLLNPSVHKIHEKPILSMIHKYNIDELNIPDRSIKALPGFKNEDTSQPKGLYHTSQAQAFGYG
jgi:hypothetical protein